MIDRNERSRLIYRAEAIERNTKMKGRPYGALGLTGLVILRCLLFRFAHQQDPSYKAIRRATGLAFSTISGALHRLELAGFLVIVRRVRSTPLGRRVINNLYRLTSPLPCLIPAAGREKEPQSFVPYSRLEGPLRRALDSLGAKIAAASLIG
jgi:DNA-binding MarR family transcriptional regulator